MIQLAIVLGRLEWRAEGSVLAVLVVAPRKDSVIVLGCGGRVRRLASASCDDAPARKGVHRGRDIVRRNVDQRGRSADGGGFRRDGLDGRALVADSDPSSGWISSRLEMGATVEGLEGLQFGIRSCGGHGRGWAAESGGGSSKNRNGMHRGSTIELVSPGILMVWPVD
ncbi:hypothetical protein MKX08_008939 [Trichoderma sp. CBMAI-0020]|nr:hypothetical protein MKX08_008939 [Trichoderma sp. CBMAI-0020]